MLLRMPTFQIAIDTEFCAAHAIELLGVKEPMHGHNWRVTAIIESTQLDDDGLVCDFHRADAELQRIIDPFRNQTLNDVPPFDTLNPSAEHVALHIANALDAAIGAMGAAKARVASVSVTEAPGCRAIVHL